MHVEMRDDALFVQGESNVSVTSGSIVGGNNVQGDGQFPKSHKRAGRGSLVNLRLENGEPKGQCGGSRQWKCDCVQAREISGATRTGSADQTPDVARLGMTFPPSTGGDRHTEEPWGRIDNTRCGRDSGSVCL